MPIYAAYGSNMHPDQMSERAPHSPMAGTGWLSGWRLTFGGGDIGWEGALATVTEDRSDPDAKVFVVLYDVTERDESSLDSWEGSELGIHRKIRARVDTDDGPVLAWLYVLDAFEGGLPSARYLGVMAEAAEIAGAPSDYVHALRVRDARNVGPGPGADRTSSPDRPRRTHIRVDARRDPAVTGEFGEELGQCRPLRVVLRPPSPGRCRRRRVAPGRTARRPARSSRCGSCAGRRSSPARSRHDPRVVEVGHHATGGRTERERQLPLADPRPRRDQSENARERRCEVERDQRLGEPCGGIRTQLGQQQRDSGGTRHDRDSTSRKPFSW